MNKLVVIGRLTDDGRYETKTFADGVTATVYNNTIAVNERKPDGSILTEYFDFAAWRGQADNCNKYCVKGMKVAISGKASIARYEDRFNRMVAKLKVRAVDEIEFCDHGKKVRTEEPLTDEYEDELDAAYAEAQAAPIPQPAPVAAEPKKPRAPRTRKAASPTPAPTPAASVDEDEEDALPFD